MTGFSFKSIVLQIIQGFIILLPLAFCKFITTSMVEEFSNGVSFYTLILIGSSFVMGVLVDFLADTIEVLILKARWIIPPSYYLLNYGSVWGIRLAHHKKIKKDLIIRATQTAGLSNPEKDLSFLDFNNLIFQTAKNKTFKECSDYQREHLESFFILYVFCRNLALSIIIAFIAIILFYFESITKIPWFVTGIVLLFAGMSILASYRYFIYYSRMVLGATFNASMHNKH